MPLRRAQAWELERWARPRPEPVTLELDAGGWTLVHDVDAQPPFPNERSRTWSRGDARIELRRIWDLPLSPGAPMQAASQAAVSVGGRPAELVTTSMFDGIAQVVRAVWLTGAGHDVEYTVRLVFDGCTDDEIADVLGRVTVHY